MEFVIPQSIVDKFAKLKVANATRWNKLFSEDENRWFDNHNPKLVYWLWYYCGKKNEFEWPTCKTCGALLTWDHITSKGIKKYCDRKCCAKDPERLEKTRQTFLKKYGGNAPICDPAVREKMRRTNQERYGYDFPFESEKIQNKVKQTTLEKYGVDNPAKSEQLLEKRSKTARKNNYQHYKQMVEQLHHVQLLSTEQEFIASDTLQFKCDQCSHEWTRERCVAQLVVCPKCINNFSTSTGEFELVQFIQSIYNGKIVRHDRSILENHQELDIYIPEYKLAIEYNGNWWHNELYCDKNYHITKTQLCNEKEIRLIHVFEYEWLYKQQQIKNIIRSAFKQFDQVVYARNCVVQNIDNQTYKQFIELNHLERSVNSSNRLGLFYNNQLIAVASFGKSRYKKDEVELYRFCTKSGVRVVGGLSKLIKHSGYGRIISYVDLAHFTGNGYKAAGFKLVKQTTPNYQYTNGQKLIDRLNCQKHKLPQLLKEKFDPNLTEGENMAQIGYYKLYDCGNLKFEWNKNENV